MEISAAAKDLTITRNSLRSESLKTELSESDIGKIKPSPREKIKSDPKIGLDVQYVLRKNDSQLVKNYLGRILTSAEFNALKDKQVKEDSGKGLMVGPNEYVQNFQDQHRDSESFSTTA